MELELPTFLSSVALLERALGHIVSFEEWERAYGNNAPYTQFSRYNDATGRTEHGLKPNIGPPPVLFAIAFDIINELRSSLDHAVFDAARGVGNAPTYATKFPFGDSPQDVENDMNRKKEIPEKIRPLLASFKPYKGGDTLLWGLNKTRNSKIHRILQPLASYSPSLGIGSGVSLADTEFMSAVPPGPDGSIVFATTGGRSDLGFQVRADVRLTFGADTPFSLRPAGELFKQFHSRCWFVVQQISKAING